MLCGDDLEQQADEVDTNYAPTNKERDYVKDPTTEIAFHPVVILAVHEFFDRRIPSYNGFWVVRKTITGWEGVNIHL